MRGFVAGLALFLLSFSVSGEPKVLWQVTIGVPGGGTIRDGAQSEGMEVDSQGNVYALFYLQGRGPYELGPGARVAPSVAQGTSVLAKYSPLGKLLWFRAVPDVWYHGLGISPSGEIAVVGESRTKQDTAFGSQVVLSHPTGDFNAPWPFVVFYNASGDALRLRTLRVDLPADLLAKRPFTFGRQIVMGDGAWNAIAFDPNGDYYVGGHQGFYSYLGEGVESDAGFASGYWVASLYKFDKGGKALWSRTLTNQDPIDFAQNLSSQFAKGYTRNADISKILMINGGPVVVGSFNGNGLMGFSPTPTVRGLATPKNVSDPTMAIPDGIQHTTPLAAGFGPQGEVKWLWQPKSTGWLTLADVHENSLRLRARGGGTEVTLPEGKEPSFSDHWAWEPPLAALGEDVFDAKGSPVIVFLHRTVLKDGSVVAVAQTSTNQTLTPGTVAIQGRGPAQTLTLLKYK